MSVQQLLATNISLLLIVSSIIHFIIYIIQSSCIEVYTLYLYLHYYIIYYVICVGIVYTIVLCCSMYTTIHTYHSCVFTSGLINASLGFYSHAANHIPLPLLSPYVT